MFDLWNTERVKRKTLGLPWNFKANVTYFLQHSHTYFNKATPPNCTTPCWLIGVVFLNHHKIINLNSQNIFRTKILFICVDSRHFQNRLQNTSTGWLSCDYLSLYSYRKELNLPETLWCQHLSERPLLGKEDKESHTDISCTHLVSCL